MTDLSRVISPKTVVRTMAPEVVDCKPLCTAESASAVVAAAIPTRLTRTIGISLTITPFPSLKNKPFTVATLKLVTLRSSALVVVPSDFVAMRQFSAVISVSESVPSTSKILKIFVVKILTLPVTASILPIWMLPPFAFK